MADDRLSALVMFSIEKSLIHDIEGFSDKVIDSFASLKERRMDFPSNK